MNDLSDVVSVLNSIEKELAWWKDGTTAAKILSELEKINSNLSDLDSRLRDIERSLD
jgi:hypothetical protein